MTKPPSQPKPLGRGPVAERISHEDHDETAWVCLCGNTPDSDGFATCNAKGEEVEPLIGSDWAGLYLCMRCERIIDQADLAVVGRIDR